jgi:hypothetical protein
MVLRGETVREETILIFYKETAKLIGWVAAAVRLLTALLTELLKTCDPSDNAIKANSHHIEGNYDWILGTSEDSLKLISIRT